MDDVKIGKFIAEKRKVMHLTEHELANLLHLSEKTILDWECGKALPDISIALELCNILDVTIQELLSGKKLESDKLSTHTEENNISFSSSKKDYTLKKWAAIFIITLSIFLIVMATITVSYTNLSIWIKITLYVMTFLFFFMGIILVCVLTNSMGTFKCKYCGHKFTPKNNAFIFGMRAGNKRYLKCPFCHKKSFCQFESYKKQNKI